MMKYEIMRHQLIYAIFAFVLGLLLLEVAGRIIEQSLSDPRELNSNQFGWQHKFFGSLMDWHEPDPELLWRFRAGLNNPLIKTNSHHFLGSEFNTKKDPGVYRLLLIGDSSPVGMGLTSRRQAFGERARYLLDKYAGAQKQIELINASVSGYTSEQINGFLKSRGWDYDPDIVVIYCGNNDASISGYFSDKWLLAEQEFVRLRNVLAHSAVYRILRAIIVDHRESRSVDGNSLTIRVSPKRYGQNLESIYQQCLEHNCPLVVLKPPVPYLWPAGLQFKPFLHITDRQSEVILPDEMISILGREITYCIDDDRFEEIYGTGDAFTRAVFKKAFKDTVSELAGLDFYIGAIAEDSLNPLSFNNFGVALWRHGDYQRADSAFTKARELFSLKWDVSNSPTLASAVSPILYNTGINILSMNGEDFLSPDTTGRAYFYLDSALQADFFSLRIKKEYYKQIDNFILRDLVAVIDLPAQFRKKGGEELFIDHCHPTAEGHRIIAEELVQAIIINKWL